MRFVKSLTVATLAILVCSAAMALDGGYKDTNTGKVWGDSLFALNNGFGLDWNGATTFAANYAVWDLNDNGVMTYYDDWRLPTVAEMQAACADGTIQYVNQHSPYMFKGTGLVCYFWTSDTRGKGSRSAYVVRIFWGDNGEVLGCQASLALINSSVCAYMIRP